MKTCKEVVYEQRQYTCHKTCWERVCVPKEINCVRTSPRPATVNARTRSAGRSGRQRVKVCNYTSCKPVWETCQKNYCYTVCKPVWETCQKNYCYTVCKPVYETKCQNYYYTVCQPVYETKCQNYCYTVCKPVWETCRRTTATPSASRSTRPGENYCYTVCKPVYETREKVCQYTVCKPVWETKCRELHLHGLQAGLRGLRAERVLHGVQPGALHADGQRLLRPLGDQAGGVLPAPQLHAELLRRLRLLLPGRAVPGLGSGSLPEADRVREVCPRDLREKVPYTVCRWCRRSA